MCYGYFRVEGKECPHYKMTRDLIRRLRRLKNRIMFDCGSTKAMKVEAMNSEKDIRIIGLSHIINHNIVTVVFLLLASFLIVLPLPFFFLFCSDILFDISPLSMEAWLLS